MSDIPMFKIELIDEFHIPGHGGSARGSHSLFIGDGDLG
jgi:hypothetical protein